MISSANGNVSNVSLEKREEKLGIITWVEEHVSDNGRTFVDLEWMAAEDNTFCNDSSYICVDEYTCRDQDRF